MINIVACPSDNYTMQCGVLMCSLCENNYQSAVHFYIIIDTDFSQKHKDELQHITAKYPNKEITFLQVDEMRVASLLCHESDVYTRHVFYRFFIADLLPTGVTKALYLDCDIIVRHSLDQLWAIDTTGFAIGVVHDAQEGIMEQFNRLEYSYEKGYFNSGVLLVNLRFWREHNSVQALFEYIRQNPQKIKLPDQDVLNVVFQDYKLFVPFTYNVQSALLYTKDRLLIDYTKYREELEYCIEDPFILHFSGVRPWMRGARHPYVSEWYRYRDLTQWRGCALQKNKTPFKKRLLMSNAMRIIPSKFGLCSVLRDPYDPTISMKKS